MDLFRRRTVHAKFMRWQYLFEPVSTGSRSGTKECAKRTMEEVPKPDPPTRPYMSWLVAIEGGTWRKKWWVEKNPARWNTPHTPHKARHSLWVMRRFATSRQSRAAAAEVRRRLTEELNKELGRKDEEQEAPSNTTDGSDVEGQEAEVTNRELLRNMPTWTRP